MGKNYGNYGNQSKQNTKQKGRKSPPPYKFIEPNDKVFYPQDFGEILDSQISFEKPFSDTQSGILELKIIAKSDIFTGGFEGKNTDNKTPKAFFKISDSYALSGSSVRGVVRTIAQVLSFGKFTTDAPDYKKKGEFVPRIKSNFDKNKETRLDMTERIFGAIINANGKNFALKSRISFSHFIASKVCRAQYANAEYISTKPDFQKSKIYKDKNGFKIYTALGKITNPDEIKKNDKKDKNKKMPFIISPLGAGTEFVGKLRYFNLTKAELGLILLCLSALDSTKGEYYKFGGAKFYGYGDAQILLKGIDESLKRECINAYKNLLSKTDFKLDSRINDLRQKSKKQDSTQSTDSQNSHQKPRESTTNHSNQNPHHKLDKYRKNHDTDDDDDDSHHYL